MRALLHLAGGFVAAVVIGGQPAAAQAPDIETRLVQAFQRYCMATAADPTQFEGMLVETGRNLHVGLPETVSKGFQLVLDGDPHRRIQVDYVVEIGPDRPSRMCRVDVAYADIPLVRASLARALMLVDGTSMSILEGRYETEVTQWITRIGNTDAVIEFHAPTYANAPGRSLALIVRGQ